MGTGTLLAAVIAMAPFFEEKAQMPIAVVDAHSVQTGIPVQEMKRDAVCEALGIQNCGIHRGYFSAHAPLDGASSVFSFSSGEGQAVQSVCVVELPSTSRSPGYSYIRGKVASLDYTGSGKYSNFSDDDIRSLNLLAQFASCDQNSSSDETAKRLRSVTFAVLVHQLMKGEHSFLLKDGTNPSLFIAAASEEAPIDYGNAVAQRILMEGYKQNIASMIKSKVSASRSRCTVSVQTDRDPLLNVPHYQAPARERGGPDTSFSRVAKLKRCMFPPSERANNYHSIVVDDSLVTEIAASGPPPGYVFVKERGMRDPYDDGLSGVRSAAFAWSPFKNFGGSTRRGLEYAWGVASQLTGLQH